MNTATKKLFSYIVFFDKVCSERAAILCQNYYCSIPNVLNILDVMEKQNERLTSRNGWKNFVFLWKKNVLQDWKYLLPFLSTDIILWLLLWPGIKSWNIWYKYTVSHCQLVPWFWANKWTWAHSSKQTLAFSLESTH